MTDQMEPLEADRSPAMARRGLLAAGGAALAGAAIAALAAADKADAGHTTAIAYDTETSMHLDVTNTTAGSTRISSNVSGTAAFVGLNNYPVGISRPDGILGRTAYSTSNAAGVAGASQAASGGIGVLGCSQADTGTGVYGFSGSSVPSEVPPAGTGVFGIGPVSGLVGRSTTGTGVRGESTSGAAVHGEAQAGNGVEGTSVTGVGVLGTAGATGIAGKFVGRTIVEGVLETQGIGAIGAVRANKLVLPKTSGAATLPRAAASITVPNLPVGPVTMALATLQKRVKGLHIEAAVPSPAGKSVTIYFNKRAPKGTKVSWMLVN